MHAQRTAAARSFVAAAILLDARGYGAARGAISAILRRQRLRYGRALAGGLLRHYSQGVPRLGGFAAISALSPVTRHGSHRPPTARLLQPLADFTPSPLFSASISRLRVGRHTYRRRFDSRPMNCRAIYFTFSVTLIAPSRFHHII